VKSWFATAYRPDLTTIVVIGDTTPEAAKAIVEKYFGHGKRRGRSERRAATRPAKRGKSSRRAGNRARAILRALDETLDSGPQ